MVNKHEFISVRQKMYEVIKASCSKHLGKPLDVLVKKLLVEGESQIEMKHVGRLHFGNFMEPDANPKIYDEVIQILFDKPYILIQIYS
jgi:dynein heavy chain, axonemal